MRITKFNNNNDHEYINCGIIQKVKYGHIWEFDDVAGDWYSFNLHLYMSEYERMQREKLNDEREGKV